MICSLRRRPQVELPQRYGRHVAALEEDGSGGRSVSRRTVRPKVVLPQPLSPTNPKVSPGRKRAKLTPSTALTAPRARPKRPEASRKCLTRPSTFKEGGCAHRADFGCAARGHHAPSLSGALRQAAKCRAWSSRSGGSLRGTGVREGAARMGRSSLAAMRAGSAPCLDGGEGALSSWSLGKAPRSRSYRGCCGLVKSASTGARSTTAGIHDGDSCASSRWYAEVWVIMTMAVPNSACSSRMRSRIWAWMVTLSAVVGRRR